MTVTPLRTVGPYTSAPPGQGSAQPGRGPDVAKLAGILVLVTTVLLATLIVGIVIGNVARKRFDRWSRGL